MVLAIFIGRVGWAGQDIMPFQDVGFGWMGSDVWHRTGLDVLVFASQTLVRCFGRHDRNKGPYLV